MTYRNILIQVHMLKCVFNQKSPCLLSGLLKYLIFAKKHESGYLDLKLHIVSPFCIFSIDFADFFYHKGDTL